MPGPSLELEMRLKDQKVQVGMDALAAKEEKVGSTLAKISKEAKQADAELTKFAKRTTEINTTPLEKYNRQLFVLEQALARGKISQDTYGRAVKKAGQDLEEAGKKQQSAFGADAIGQLKGFAAGYLTLGTAVNVVASAFANAREESKEALSSLRGLDAQRRKLVQMADSPQDLQAMLARADQAAAASGVDRGTAYEALFQARSFGFEKDYEKILSANEVIDVGASSQLAGKVSTMFGGEITGMEAINMSLAASKKSEVDAESIAGALAIALEGGRRVGATPDETFAWTAALSAAFKSPQVGTDRIKAITNKAAAEPSLRSAGGLTEIMKRLQAMPESERAEILGKDQESNAAFEAMVEFYRMEQAIEADTRAARLATGTSKAPLAIGMAVAAGTEQTQASATIRRAEIGTQIEQEGAYAVAEAQRNAAILGVRTGAYRRRASIGERMGVSTGGMIASSGQFDPSLSTLAAEGGGSVGGMVQNNAIGALAYGPFGVLAGTLIQLTKDTNRWLQQIASDKGPAGSVTRAVSAAGLAPQN